MGEIEVVKASKSVKRRQPSYSVASNAKSSFPNALILEDSHKLAQRAVLAVRRGPIRYRRNSTIVCEGDPADYVFMAVDGIVRRCKAFQNGTRAIVDFHIPGEVVGWADEAKNEISFNTATGAINIFLKRS